MQTNARRFRPPIAERILVIRLGALGDVLRTLPAVEALRALHPGSHLCWLVEPAPRAAVQAVGRVDEVLVFPRGELVEAMRRGRIAAAASRLRAFAHLLRSRRFELVIDFHGLAKSGLLARLTGAPLRYGHAFGVAREGSALLTNRHAERLPERLPRFDRNAALLRALSPGAEVDEGPLLAASPAARARLAQRLRADGREQARGFVLIHPGSSAGAEHKRYSASGWTRVANRLAQAGVDVWLMAGSGADEQALASGIRAGCDARVVAAPATEGFDDLLALIERASVFAAGDTGPLHAASLCGVPVVQLLGPTDPVQNRPLSASPWRRVHVPLPCSPCRRGCPEAACMRALTPERVVDAILALRSETGEGRVLPVAFA